MIVIGPVLKTVRTERFGERYLTLLPKYCS